MKSRPAGSRQASAIQARSGSCRQGMKSPTAVGTSIAFKATDTAWAPGHVVRSDDKRWPV